MLEYRFSSRLALSHHTHTHLHAHTSTVRTCIYILVCLNTIRYAQLINSQPYVYMTIFQGSNVQRSERKYMHGCQEAGLHEQGVASYTCIKSASFSSSWVEQHTHFFWCFVVHMCRFQKWAHAWVALRFLDCKNKGIIYIHVHTHKCRGLQTGCFYGGGGDVHVSAGLGALSPYIEYFCILAACTCTCIIHVYMLHERDSDAIWGIQ